jgi:hypothetical protein
VRPSIFIGSSSEGLPVAKAIQTALGSNVTVTTWPDVFSLGDSTLESLMRVRDEFDFAVLVLTPDDLTTSRGSRRKSPRDNVLFELGLFMGALGRHRTFAVFDKSVEVKIPSDLAGITLAVVGTGDASESLSEFVKPATDRISEAIARHGTRRADPSPFWAPFLSDETVAVVGKFSQFDSFEASGLVGFGDAACVIEVLASLRNQHGFELPLRYADQFDANALGGNLVLVGGPDANSITRTVLRRVDTDLQFGDADRNQISFFSRATDTAYVPETGRDFVDYGVLIRARNPFASENVVLLMFGCFGYGTWAAGRYAVSLQFLREGFVSSGRDFECVVRTEVIRGIPQPATMCEFRPRG